jgi:DNA-binding GntR family transcriptional regulator
VLASQLARALGPWRRRPHAPGRDLEDALRDAVLLGRIPVAARLPSERTLAAALGLSRGTVGATYGRLRDGGWLTTRTGAGSVTALPGTLNARLAAPGGWRPRAD